MRRRGRFFDEDNGPAGASDQSASPVDHQEPSERAAAPGRARTPRDLRRLERELGLQRERRFRRQQAGAPDRQVLQPRSAATDLDPAGTRPPRPPNRWVASRNGPVAAPPPAMPSTSSPASAPSSGSGSIASSHAGPSLGSMAAEPEPAAHDLVPALGTSSPDGPSPRPAGIRPRRSRPDMPGGTLARNSAVMAGGTFLSRLTGFARVLLVATVLGTTGLGDAYNLANSVPNIVYDLLLGGILSATLVPVFVEEFSKEDIDEGDRAISSVLTAICAALFLISVALYFLAPLVLRFYLLFNHSSAQAAERAVGTSLLRMFAPQVFFLGAIVVSTALLNARRRFAIAAFSPVANNLIAIAAILVTWELASNLSVGPFRHEHRALVILGLGTTLGYLVQLLLQVPSMRQAGVRLWPSWNLRHPAVRRVASLSVWLIGVVVANQVALNVILVLAASTSGDATVYTTAYQFFQLPYALFTVSVASALTPDLAERWTNRDRLGFQRRVITGLRVALGILIPAAAGYAIIAQPLISLAVHYGHVTPSGAHNIGVSLALFAIGLPGFSAFVLLMRAYQAMQDTRTMFWMYALENAITLVLAGICYPLMGVRGLALAWVAPYTVVAAFAAVHLQRRTGTLGGALTLRALGRILFATIVMTVVLLALNAVLPHGGGHVGLIVRLIVLVGAGTAVYVGAARALGIEEVEPVLRLVRLGR